MTNTQLTSSEIDALSEMGNIGTGNAATALSKFINKNVDMNIPETKFVPLKDFSKLVGGPEKIIVGVYLQISGDIEGESLFIFPREGALEMIDILMGKPPGTTKIVNEMDESAFKEMTNVITGAFLNSMANMFDVKLVPSVPHIATDMAQTVLDFILIKVSRSADSMLCVKTTINVEGHRIDGEFLVLFDEKSLKKILKTLHQKYGEAIR
ncbi:MAG: chemotaxis protein CheC [archaeon]